MHRLSPLVTIGPLAFRPSLGLPSLFTVDGIGVPDGLEFRARVRDQQQQAWADLHVSPRTALSGGAKLCTYHRWFGRPDVFRMEP